MVSRFAEAHRDIDQAIRLGIRQGAQEHRIDHGEDGGGGADAQAEREHHRCGESGIAAQHPRGVGEVPRQRLQKWNAAAVAVALFGRFNAAQPDDRLSPGLGRRKAGANAVFHVQLKVGFQFLGELAVSPVLAEQALETD